MDLLQKNLFRYKTLFQNGIEITKVMCHVCILPFIHLMFMSDGNRLQTVETYTRIVLKPFGIKRVYCR